MSVITAHASELTLNCDFKKEELYGRKCEIFSMISFRNILYGSLYINVPVKMA